jgi:hypothetical protein
MLHYIWFETYGLFLIRVNSMVYNIEWNLKNCPYNFKLDSLNVVNVGNFGSVSKWNYNKFLKCHNLITTQDLFSHSFIYFIWVLMGNFNYCILR